MGEASRKEAIMTAQNPGNRFYQARAARRRAKERSQNIFLAFERGQEDEMTQCKGTTAAGIRCKIKTNDSSGYCPAHRNQAAATRRPARTNRSTPAPVPVRQQNQQQQQYLIGGALALLLLVLLGVVVWSLFFRPVREVRVVETQTVVQTVEVEKEVIKTVEVLVTVEVEPTARPTEAPAQPAPAQPGGICEAYKIDFTHGDGVPLYTIDAGSPREREIVNLWMPGEKETTYIFPRMTVIRALFKGYGNMWKFPAGCDFENLVERAVSYAKDTTPSNHTGEVWLVNSDGSLSLITKDAFGYVLDMNNLPADPTK